MANKMKEVAELLGVEINEPFNIKGYKSNPCKIIYDGMVNNQGMVILIQLSQLLTGEFEIEKQVLNDSEKNYLKNLFRPFKDTRVYIEKVEQFGFECISYQIIYEYISYKSFSPTIRHEKKSCELPYFDKGTMYKGMVLGKQYSLEELELFESEDEDIK